VTRPAATGPLRRSERPAGELRGGSPDPARARGLAAESAEPLAGAL